MTSRREPLVPRRKPSFSIAIPASIVSDVPHPREKTAKIGLIGRSAAIFRVDEVVVYEDVPGGDSEFIRAVLTYMETPQYLRKALIGMRPELRYAGILPPLRTPHHPLRARSGELRDGEFREGVVVKKVRSGCLVDIGVERPLLAPGLRARPGERLTFMVVRRRGSLSLRAVRAEDVPYYWGYKVRVFRGALRDLLSSPDYDLVIGTSRLGVQVNEVAEELAGRLASSSRVLIAFGGPDRGLYDMAGEEGFDLEEVCDFVLNTVPYQGVATVRTEEAVLATLAILNFLTAPRNKREPRAS